MKKVFYKLLGTKQDMLWGIVNAVLICVPVYLVNMGEFGQYAAVGKQALYAFFVGSQMVRLVRHIIVCAIGEYHVPVSWAVRIAVAIVFIINVTLNILLHSIKGTPDPQTTVLVVSMLTLAGLIFVGQVQARKIK